MRAALAILWMAGACASPSAPTPQVGPPNAAVAPPPAPPARDVESGPARAESPPAALEAPPRADAAPPPPPPLAFEAVPRVSEVDAAIVARVRALREVHPEREEAVFVKLGSSSTVNRGFLHCFAGRRVELGAYADLQPTLDLFRTGRIGSRTPFDRRSEAARVGWSIRSAMIGDPNPVQRELRASDARWALALFGPNDVERENARLFAERLDWLVRTVLEEGALPILASITPRRDDPAINAHITRHNRVIYVTARAWGLPFMDFHAALRALPRRGVLGDGQHPNVYRVRGTRRACHFTPRGLRYGHNQRNLLVLRTLDALRRATLADGMERPDAPREDPALTVEATTARAPAAWIHALPFGARHGLSARPSDAIPESCEDADAATSARVASHGFRLSEATRVRVEARGLAGVRPAVALRDADGQCLRLAARPLVAALEPGEYAIELYAGAGRETTLAWESTSPAILLGVTRAR